MTPCMLLYPTPRSLTLLPGTVPADVPVHRNRDPSMDGEEAYRLEIRDGAVALTARTATGLRWADGTLAQIRAQHPATLPCLAIEDSPAFAYRGFMLDISRDRVPTLATLHELVVLIARLKGNRLQLYIEHALAYEGHEVVWDGASPLSLAELSELDRFAQEHGVTIDANQNCLGHLERWLRHPRYAPLAELSRPTMIDLPWGRQLVQPSTLCPIDEGAFALVRDLLGQQIPAVSGEFVNIGCDEPWDLGLGRSKAACAKEGRGHMFSRWVSRVARQVRELGRTPMYWCDPHPNEDNGLPNDLIALVWGYEHDEDFATRAAAHRAAGRSVWVCPGTGCWNSTTGRTWYRRGNLAKAAAEAGTADGFLLTAWGDGGHHQPWPLTLMGLADGLQAAWSGGSAFNNGAAGLFAFGDSAVGGWLAELGDADEPFSRQLRNVNALVHDFRTPWTEPNQLDDIAVWRSIQSRLHELAQRVPGGPWADECRLAVDLSAWAAERAVLRRGPDDPAARSALEQQFAPLVATHRQQWLRRCRPGGLDDSCHLLEANSRRRE